MSGGILGPAHEVVVQYPGQASRIALTRHRYRYPYRKSGGAGATGLTGLLSIHVERHKNNPSLPCNAIQGKADVAGDITQGWPT